MLSATKTRRPVQATGLPSALGVILFLLISPLCTAAPPSLSHLTAGQAGMDAATLDHIDQAVAEALRREKMPGCVVVIGRRNGIVFHRAYGKKQLKPTPLPMTTDTVFDMASITKPLATALSIMQLVEQEKVQLDKRVAHYLPGFAANGKQDVTVRQLLTHQGGLIPDNALSDYDDGQEEAFRRIDALKTYVDPGTRFVYTDVGFIVLARIVEKVTGQDIHEYSHEHIFGPLGMTETGFLPAPPLQQRAAPTEQREGKWIQGEVHDPRAFALGGVAGHAGLFSTGEDLARMAIALLSGGQSGESRILDSTTLKQMTRPIKTSTGLRGLGWDIRSGYSSNRGDIFSDQAFGHGGFTGTTFWVDPGLDLFVVFLSNRVHPDGNGSVNALAGRIGTIAAASIRQPARPPTVSATRPVLAGIDVLERAEFRQLRGQRVGLITNQTGRNLSGMSTVEVLHKSPHVDLVALFSPEHGLEGKLELARIADSRDNQSGLKVFSLYGKTRVPTAESLEGIDTLIFDVQDIGTRFYTFVSTMGNCMRAAAEHNVRFVVLDRPNPIGGIAVQGPVLDAGSESFVGFHTLPVRHGMTVGELARMFNSELKLKLNLEVIHVQGWRREDMFDKTGRLWLDPSPNMRSLTQALLYPGIGLLETTNISVGRGTDTPFERIGAPWIDGRQLAAELNRAGLQGVRFLPIEFTPDASKFKEQGCGGVYIQVTSRDDFQPLRLGLQLAVSLRRLYPDDWDTASLNRLLSSETTQAAILAGKSVDDIQAGYRRQLQEFKQRRRRYLLY